MLTDSPPRKANRAGFLESDRIKTLDLPQDESLLAHTKSIEAVMKAGTSANVRAACGLCSHFRLLQSPSMRHPRACSPTAKSPRKLGNRAFRGLPSRNHVDPRLDADGGAQGGHFLRHVPEHPVPRILPSSRLSEARVSGFVAHAGFLRA